MVDASGRYVGVVTAQAIAEVLAEQPDTGPAVVGQLTEMPAPVTIDQPLAQALHTLLWTAGTGVPVLDPAYGRPVGWLSPQSVLRAVHAAA